VFVGNFKSFVGNTTTPPTAKAFRMSKMHGRVDKRTKNPKERNHLQDLDIDGETVLERILKK